MDVAFSRSVFKEHALVSILASMHWSFKYNVTDVVLFSFSTFGGMYGARRSVPSVDLIEDFVSWNIRKFNILSIVKSLIG